VKRPGDPRIGSPLLMPFDGSTNAEAVFPYVPLLANGRREVILLQVVPAAETISSPLGEVMLSAEDVRDASERAARADLERAAGRLAQHTPRLRIEQVIATGDPAEQIVRLARERETNTILLSSQGASAIRPGGFGSVVGKVVRITPAPVVVVQPGASADDVAVVSRLILAHDGSERAARALPLIQELAARLAAAVHIIAVVEDEASILPPSGSASIHPHLLEQAQADVLNAARRRVEAVGATFLRKGLPASWQVLAGPAAATIMGVSRTHDVLVITSHGQGGSRWLLGSVAEKLVRESPVPVILLRTLPESATGVPS
jgi:nucleotide-binding universal stress UspA family protein